jgi:hypothetical protein
MERNYRSGMVGDQRGGSHAAERRSQPRYVASVHRVWLGWWLGKNFQTFPGQLWDISPGGAAVVLHAAPPTGQSVWLRLEAGPLTTECAQGFVAEVAPIVPGINIVRIAFEGQCPAALFQVAVHGYKALGSLLN